jgi:lipoic acid synthetase
MRRTFLPLLCAASGSGSSQTAGGDTASTSLPIAKQQFLSSFRAKLSADADKSSLESFVDPPSPTSISAMSLGPIKRGEEPLPPWLKLKIPKGFNERPRYNQIRNSMRSKKLSTVCEEAKCPNIGECWGGGDGEAATATIMLMGSHCTRGCRFCSVMTSRTPPPLDPEEPEKTAAAVAEMGVDYIVMTMVDRDDIGDGGASHVRECIRAVKERSPTLLLEALVGDFHGDLALVSIIANSGLNVYAHNIECVERITPNVRDRRATYRQSLTTLEHALVANPSLVTKSSIMLGLGEREEEVRQALRDLRSAGVQAVTLGQYLQPSRTRLKVSRYAHPSEFAMWEKEAMAMGFLYCASGPMVRSSYRAGEYYLKSIVEKKANPNPGSI